MACEFSRLMQHLASRMGEFATKTPPHVAKSLVPYRQCSACRNFRLPVLLLRSIVDTAICAKPLARCTYGDWMPPTES
jgi:hypothetical protein